ncbi:hypothetical protein [Falsiroseomonas sp.]|uniref:hypothetical protein n=1 Tax=Falsiroseomonas sp. TaxID=2870721 RepID=UPI003F6F7EA9
MAKHQAEVAELIQRGLDWDAAAKHFHAAGLVDAGGRPPTGSTAAETWRRLALSREATRRIRR